MITVLHLTEVNGKPIAVGFPADRPFILRVIPPNSRGPEHTMITFGVVWARVRETPKEVLDLLQEEAEA